MESSSIVLLACLIGFCLVQLGVLARWHSKQSLANSVRSAPESRETPLLASDLEKLEAEIRGLKTEWIDTYSKLNRLAGRLARERGWDAVKAPETDEGGEDGVQHPRTRAEVMRRARRSAIGGN